MTPLELNALGFEGDRHLGDEIKRLVDEYIVDWIVETGTYLGNTTLKLAEMSQYVHVCTVESNIGYYTEASMKFVGKNITSFHADSADCLARLLPIISQKSSRTLFFLDAHWGPHNPLLRELELIAQLDVNPVIVIHDFKVPDHPELGFDSYGGQDYDWAWIENSINQIYGPNGFAYHYNSIAEVAKRGVIFIEPLV